MMTDYYVEHHERTMGEFAFGAAAVAIVTIMCLSIVAMMVGLLIRTDDYLALYAAFVTLVNALYVWGWFLRFVYRIYEDA